MLGFTENIWTIAGKVKAVVCSPEFDYINKALTELGIWIFDTLPCADIDRPVSSHADMLFCYFGSGQAVCHKSQIELAHRLSKMGLDVSFGKSSLKKKYPHDIAFDFLLTEKFGFGNIRHTEKEILSFCARSEIKTVDVKQGYAKCSCLAVDGKSIITADSSIADAAKQRGLDALLISPGQIDLPGYDCGFIGGCAGYIAKDIIAFTGDVAKHSDFDRIEDFLHSRGKSYVCLSDRRLLDVGGIIPVIEEY